MIAEETRFHTRILRCALQVEECRAWWRRVDPDGPRPSAEQVYTEWWFGNKSMPRVELLIQNLRARFDAFPGVVPALKRWSDLGLRDATTLCHWHLQLSDPLYRAFTGRFLPARRALGQRTITRDEVIAWVSEQALPQWGVATRIQFASKLLSAAFEAGLVLSNRDPRPLGLPGVSDDALTWLLYLCRAVQIEGDLLDNPYMRSVGLSEDVVFARLAALPDLAARRLGGVVELDWRYPDLLSWAQARAERSAA